MARISVIVGFVRRDRQGIKVDRWIEKKLQSKNHPVFFVDLLELNLLPLLDRIYKETNNRSEKNERTEVQHQRFRMVIPVIPEYILEVRLVP